MDQKEEKIVVGIWGAGVVGQATGYVFEVLCPDKVEVIYYDTDPKKGFQNNKEELLNRSNFVFLCLPTPMRVTGEISLQYIDDSLKEIRNFFFEKALPSYNQIFIIRSTSVSGSTDHFASKYNLTLAFCPEFLTEANSKEDALLTNRIVIGTNDLWVRKKIENLFRTAYESGVDAGSIDYIHLSRAEAEMFKYFSNIFLASQVMVANELYFVCRKLGLNYDKIRKGLINDRRIGTFTQVPGPDGDFGVGGKCLVPGTMVFTDNFQLLPIEEIQIGDKIFDGSKFTEVTKTGARFVNDLIDIKSRGRKITGSPDHIQLVYNPVSLIEKQLKDIDIITDKLFIPLPDNNSSAIIHLGPVPNNKNRKVWHEKIELNNQIARLIGLYLAEGCISGKSTIWSFGEKEEDFANEVVSILSKEFGIHSRKFLQISNGVSRCWMVKARSEWLKTFLKEMNTGKKGIEKDIRIIPKQFIPSLIGGWLDGDGNSERNTISGFSRSKKLILKMDYMLLSLGICCSIGKNGQEVSCGKRDDVKEITSWTKRHKKYNDNNYSRKKSNASPNTFFTTVKYKDSILQGWVTDIQSINKSEGGKVISLETKSGTYVANNILTHNCFPKDVNAFIYLAKENGIVPYILETMMKWNDHIRLNKDWLSIPGATEDCGYEQELEKEEIEGE